MTVLQTVKDFFPELTDDEADAVLWHLTGWPGFWFDDSKNLEQNLRGQLAEIKQKQDEGRSIGQQMADYDKYVDAEMEKWRK